MVATFSLLTTLLLLCPLWAQAFSAVIWQPQLRDQQISASQWQQLMQRLPAQGIDTLVLQWSQYGDTFSQNADQQWLLARTKAARAAGLRLVIGLYADPEFFERQKQPDAAVGDYFNRLRAHDRQLAAQWLKALGAQSISGWYLSAEIDDLRWRTPQSQQALLQWLQQSRADLKQIADKPLAVSSFFVGNMSPEDYRQLIQTLSSSGVKVWVQDGAGVARLDPAVRQHYLDPLLHCPSPAAAGVIYERFRPHADGKGFQPLTTVQGNNTAILPAAAVGCAGDSLVFELRYLPQSKGIMAY